MMSGYTDDELDKAIAHFEKVLDGAHNANSQAERVIVKAYRALNGLNEATNRLILASEKWNEFQELVKPLLKYLCENYHPHVTVIVTPTRAELVEGLMTARTDEFLVD